MVRTSMKVCISPQQQQQATQHNLELSLGTSLMRFVKEQMHLLNMSSVTEYVAKLVSEERARRALQEDVRLKQLEIRALSALRRRTGANLRPRA
jgi:hypothetical protein